MKLVSFSVENYRSITTARKIPLDNYSLLIGANNEGKSNILHALALGMNALTGWVSTVRRLPDGRIMRAHPSSLPYRSAINYDWAADYPVGKQDKAKADACTKITLEFQLGDSELVDFRNDINSSLNGTLPIVLSFGRSGYDLSVQKPGRGHATLNRKSTRIASFVSGRIRFSYIPAIRTSASASEVIAKLVERELRVVEDNLEYVNALNAIEEIQKPIFDDLAETIKRTISGFLPNVRSVELRPAREARYRSLRRDIQILIDDGSLTKLSRKGDGVQSLTALALMRHASEEASETTNSIVAIEEPESHLHPRAIHELRSVIESISEKSQIFLTSHSPLFVRPGSLHSTVVVQNSKARIAEHISEVRDALGVRFSDNLQNARLVLVLEGKEDVVALEKIIPAKSKLIRKAIEDGLVAFDHLGGASSLSQKASFYQSAACDIQAFIDNDQEGKLAVDKALKARALKVTDVNLSAVPGKEESELEDLYDKNVYQDAFLREFGVDIKRKPTGKKNGKWSEITERLFVESGKPWSDLLKNECKMWLAHFAASNSETIVLDQISGALSAFVGSVERKIDSM